VGSTDTMDYERFLRVHHPPPSVFGATKFGQGNILFVWQAVRDLQKVKL